MGVCIILDGGAGDGVGWGGRGDDDVILDESGAIS